MSTLCPQCRRTIDVADLSSNESFCPHCGATLQPDPGLTIDDHPAATRAPAAFIEDGAAAGPYRLLRRLGRGGMGVVYEAEDTRLGRRIAVKFLPEAFVQDPQRLERFHREARAASALNHPNICTVYDVGEQQGLPFIVMEYVEGRTFRSLMTQPVPGKTLAQLGAQVARALAAAHAAGIVHRDIKPENLMLRPDGYVKVVDFGLALLLSSPTAAVTPETAISTLGVVMGTVGYMSPEQARGETVTGATDVFSLGVTFYELGTGRRPFAADSPVGVMQSVLRDSPLPARRLNPELPAALDVLISRMLDKRAESRPSAAEVESTLAVVSNESAVLLPAHERATSRRRSVGRQKERAKLLEAFESAAVDHGLLVCVAGEPGIGKTTLVEDFIGDVRAAGRPFAVARGRCSERLAGTEAYLPVLEALDSLLQGGMAELAARTLKRVAPSWYAQVSSQHPNESFTVADPRVSGSQERIKREMGAFLQELSLLQPLVLFLDDLHWADISTVDLLAYLATKFDSLRLLVVAAFRPSDLLLAKHPFVGLKLDLMGRGLCRDLSLEFLSLQDVEAYLSLEFPGHRFPQEVPRLVHTKTEGNALFMVDLLRYLRDRAVLAEEGDRWILARPFPEVERDLPASVRGMIERKIGQLREEDRLLLVAASVQGYEFDSAVVSQAIQAEPADVEEKLVSLERVFGIVRLIEEREFPDGTLTARYRFVHVLYQNAFHAALTPSRKASLSTAIAQVLLRYYRERSQLVASELALLFEAARDFGRASGFFLLAARNAARVCGHQEAIVLTRRGLEMLERQPDTPERTRQELSLQLTLGMSLQATRGWSSAEVGQAYGRAHALCQQLGESPQLFAALLGLCAFYANRAQFDICRDLGDHVLRAAKNPVQLVLAHISLGTARSFLGELNVANQHFAAALSLYNAQERQAYLEIFATDPWVFCTGLVGRDLCILGYPDQGLTRVREALAVAEGMGHPHSLAFALFLYADAHQYRGEARECQERSEVAIEFARAHDMSDFLEWASMKHGWALAQQGRTDEGIAELRASLAARQATGSLIGAPGFLAHLAESLGRARCPDDGLNVLDEAFALATSRGGSSYLAELHRLKGELLLQRQPSEPIPAEASFRKAIEIARRQGAKSWELRAVKSLSRVYVSQGRRDEARQMLAETYSWFTEGFDTPDLREAKALLEELA